MSKVIEVSDETWEKIKGQVQANNVTFGSRYNGLTLEAMIGEKWFVRTVTFHIVGRIVGVTANNDLVMSNASWVANSGRFTQAISNGVLDEVEPVGDCIVRWDSVTDAFPWKHALPVLQK